MGIRHISETYSFQAQNKLFQKSLSIVVLWIDLKI